MDIGLELKLKKKLCIAAACKPRICLFCCIIPVVAAGRPEACRRLAVRILAQKGGSRGQAGGRYGTRYRYIAKNFVYPCTLGTRESLK